MSDHFQPSTNPAVGWTDEHGTYHHAPGWEPQTQGIIFGMPIVESNLLPMPPSPGEVARRIVRHGYAAAFTDFDNWAGPVGPKPDEQTHALIIGNTMHASASLVGRLRTNKGHDGDHACATCNFKRNPTMPF